MSATDIADLGQDNFLINNMIQLIAHELAMYGDLKKWLVYTNEDVVANYEAAFGREAVYKLNLAITQLQDDFYEIKRYYQFVGVIAYKHSLGMLTMRLFESENMDNFLDGFLGLKEQDWKSEDLKKIGEITQQVIDDGNKELATILIKKVL